MTNSKNVLETTPKQSSPYATGGGGTVLEHRFGAVLLADLLLGDPIAELGDDQVPAKIVFQASRFSVVDDIFVFGSGIGEAKRRLSIGVRRKPRFARSDKATVSLFVSYLQIVIKEWDAVQSGAWRLALTVAAHNNAAQQMAILCEIARANASEQDFRASVATENRTTKQVRKRLENIDALVVARTSSPRRAA